jgi:hypothetical protein
LKAPTDKQIHISLSVPFSNLDECQLARNHIHPSGMEVPGPYAEMDIKSLAPQPTLHVHGIRLIPTPGHADRTDQ